MSTILEKGKTLLVEGPASVVVKGGKITALGTLLPVGKVIVVRKGKALPFEVEEDGQLKVTTGGDRGPLLLDGSTIPESWRRASEEIEATRLLTVVVLGGVDCGKNTFCIYLANRLIRISSKVAIIDGDVGQSDIGPPGAVSLGFVTVPVFDLFTLRPYAIAFVGGTSPSGVRSRVLDGLVTLRREAGEQGATFNLVNTDGWTSDGDAVNYKLRLIQVLAPDVVVAIQQEYELEPILLAAQEEGQRVIRVEVPKVICPRDRDVRKELREQSYRKFLEEASVRTYPLAWLRLENTFVSHTEANDKLRDLVSKLLSSPVLRCVATDRGIRAIVPRDSRVEESTLFEAAKTLGMPIKVVVEGQERGLLVALLSKDERFGGLGSLRCISFQKGTISILTRYAEIPSVVQFGRIRLDDTGREIEGTESFEL